jgi:hypothetical protein
MYAFLTTHQNHTSFSSDKWYQLVIKLAESSTHNHLVGHFQDVYSQNFQLPHWLQVICLEQGIEQVNSVVNNFVSKMPYYWILHHVVPMLTTVPEKVNISCYYLSEERESKKWHWLWHLLLHISGSMIAKPNHEFSIKFTNLSKRKQSIGCYTYHRILILSIIPNISYNFSASVFWTLSKISQNVYNFISLAFVLVICWYFLRHTVCNRQNRFGNMTGLPHENWTQFCISLKNFVST